VVCRQFFDNKWREKPNLSLPNPEHVEMKTTFFRQLQSQESKPTSKKKDTKAKAIVAKHIAQTIHNTI
jgi:hypothetical protein